MATLLTIIYIAFISLGLPDAIIGAAWPILHLELGVDISLAGLFSMIVASGTVVSSLLSEKIIRKYGTGKVTAISVMLTAFALGGITFSPHFVFICLMAIPLGLGAGAVDAALNNFVALHYKASHMNWLHCFWGVGATLGPVIISLCLAKNFGWRIGYGVIAVLQAFLVITLFSSLRLWKSAENSVTENSSSQKSTKLTIPLLLKLPSAKPTLISFFCYCGAEASMGLWGASYLVYTRNISAETAAGWVSFYFFGITVGRMITGFVALKLSNHTIIRIGQAISILGAGILFIPNLNYMQLIGFILIGLGFAPIFPAMLHETPNRFGKEMSQGIMGIQMATAYIGLTFMPPLFGLIAGQIGFELLPLFILALCITMIAATVRK